MTYAFDDRAKSGFARGEGAGALILKPLDQALKDNDNIRSVIVNTGANQDGRTIGITSPSGKAQELLMREVYARAGISPLDAGFVEAHGTGTKVGDPIEARAIYDVFGEGRSPRQPLYIGSAKSNFGHLENASGIISIIKATLMLEKGFILPNTNFETPNKDIPLAKWNMKVPTFQRPWPMKKRYISVNNFGFGGSNAHCILQAPPLSVEVQAKQENEGRQRLFVLSANDEVSIRKTMEQINIYLEQHPEVFQKGLLRDLAYTLGQRRTHLPWRMSVVASNSSELVEALASSDAKPTRASQVPKIAFVYTGQGAQWPAMGRELLDTYKVFFDAIGRADDCLKALGADFSLHEELSKSKETSRIDQAHISQPICSAVQLALTSLLKSWGITPSSVTGHSSGEIAAAYAANAISFESAMAIAYHRGQAITMMKAKFPDLRGSMMAVGAGPDDIVPLARQLTSGVAVVACENSPSSVTISGDDAAVDELAAMIESRQWFNRKLRVDVAYHSPHMGLVAEDYKAAIIDTQPASGGEVGFYSSLHGKKVDLSILDASYWVENLTCPVRFSTSLKELCLGSCPDVIIEVGPHGALEGPVKQTLKTIGEQGAKVAYFSALMRNKNATSTALKLAANLYMKGQTLAFSQINLDGLTTEQPQVLPDLIPYPWSRQKYWSESRTSQQHRQKPFPRHDLLGTLADFSNELAPTWRNILRTDDIPWLRDHKMQSLTTFPFAGFVSMAAEAAAQRATSHGVEFERFKLREIQVKRPLLMEDGVGYEIVLSMSPYAEGTRSYSDEWDDFRIWSWEQGKGWSEHCRGMIAIQKGKSSNLINSAHLGMASRKLQAAEQICSEDVITSTLYDELDSKGANYGPTFRKLSSIRASNEQAVAVIDVADTADTMPMDYQTPYYIHPALLDQVFQLSFPILGSGRFGMSTLYMPSAIRELEIARNTPSTPGDQIHVVAQGCPDLKIPKATEFSMDAMLSPGDDNAIISLVGLLMTPVKSEGSANDEPRELCYKLLWEPAEKIESEDSSGSEAGVSQKSSTGDSGYSSSIKNDKLSDARSSEDGAPVTTTDFEENKIKSAEDAQPDITADTAESETEMPSERTTLAVIQRGTSSLAQSHISDLAWVDKHVTIISDASPTNTILSSLTELLTKGTGEPPLVHTLDTAGSLDNSYVIICELHQPILSSLNAESFAHLQRLMTTSAGVLWITNGAYLNSLNPDFNMALGLTRTVRSETGATVATLDLDPDSQLGEGDKADLILQALQKVFNDEEADDMEYSEKDGVLFVPRIVNDRDMNLLVHRELCSSAPYLQDFEQSSRRLKMAIGTTGALDTLYFHDEEPYDLGDHEVEIKVHATGMNFKDVVIAMGQLPSPYLGIECAGVVSRVGMNVHDLIAGDRVCAMSEGAYSTFARCPATSAAKIPLSMSFDIAASIPVVYCTAYYGLVELGRLSEGERVLIHAAAGGVGQASIQIARMLGAEIYATVGNPEKKNFIMESYGIPEDHIFSSRDTSFAPAIREATRGAGVDVVINSLAGDFLRETWDCIAHFGRFIEIGKRDITSNSRLEMARFNYNASFSSVDLTVLAKERPKHMGRTFNAVMNLFNAGRIRPIDPITVFGIGEVETAFRLLQSGKTTGKLVVVPSAGEQVKATHARSSEELFRSDSTYIIIGGTGGLGRSLTRWMVGKGATHILLLSRSGKKEGQVAALAEDLGQSHGANIVVKACDIADADSVTSMVAACNEEMPSIAGVIHAGMVLRVSNRSTRKRKRPQLTYYLDLGCSF